MFKDEFFHDLIRKYVIVFGSCFQDIKISKERSDGTAINQIRVPISYAPREKFLARLEGEPESRNAVSFTLPRMSFEIINFQYAIDRKLNSVNQMLNRKNLQGNNVYKQVWNPVPYDISFELNIIAKTVEDGSRIIEQILPFFTPDWTVSCKLLEDMDNVVLDIPIVLNNVSMTDAYDGLFIERRSLIWTLSFTLKGVFFGSVKEAKIIKVAKVNMYPSFEKTGEHDRITVMPGLTKIGTPTEYSSQSIIQAMGVALVNADGGIDGVNVVQTGLGYDSGYVTFGPPPPGGKQARGKIIISNGVLTDVVMVDRGSGYSKLSPPYVVFTPPDLGSVPYVEIDELDDFGYVVSTEYLDESK